MGTGPGCSSSRHPRRCPLWGSDQGRSLLDAVQAAEGLRRPAAYAFKGRLFTGISGTFRIGMGEKADPNKARAMPAGSFIALAPGTSHFVSVDEETVVQLNNIGPWVLTYLDPKDDPRHQQHASAEARANEGRETGNRGARP